MKIPDEVRCKRCKNVFCCAKCRIKHEHNKHGGELVEIRIEDQSSLMLANGFHEECPVCQQTPMVFYPDMANDILEHIAAVHMPLKCEKCMKIYTTLDDLKDFSKCFKENQACASSASEETKSTMRSHQSKSSTTTISTQTSPFKLDTDLDDTNNNHLTPISMINLRWKAKSKMSENFITDSVSSIRNISCINNSSIRRSEVISSSKGKLVRSTSTPLPSDIFSKAHKEHLFHHSAQVSSIYNSGSDSDISPPIGNTPNIITPSCRTIDKISRYQKVRSRAKMPVTPLRHVMSKSIQKAIAEHGMVNSPRAYRKKILDSIDNSTGSPLDLRSSPVLRRSHSEIIESKSHLEAADLSSILQCSSTRSILLSSKKTTESIKITATRSSALKNASQETSDASGNFNSVYKSCRSVEIITETELNEINIEQKKIFTSSTMIAPITPRIAGAPHNKKTIKFETPKPKSADSNSLNSSLDEVFLTPNSSPKTAKRFDRERMGAGRKRNILMNEEENEDEEGLSETNATESIFEDGPEKKKKKTKGNLWSLVSSVMRLPLQKFGDKNELPSDTSTRVVCDENNQSSLLKRCASFAGSFVKPKSDEDMQPLKRKRTYTDVTNVSNSTLYRSQSQFNQSDLDASVSSKRFRIQGRKPIDRMRNNS